MSGSAEADGFDGQATGARCYRWRLPDECGFARMREQTADASSLFQRNSRAGLRASIVGHVNCTAYLKRVRTSVLGRAKRG